MVVKMKKIKLKIKKGDKVVVTAGSEKGKSGVVLKVFPSEMKVLIEGVNKVVRHIKPNAAYPSGGRVTVERPVHYSNVAILDPRVALPVKIGYKLLADGKKVRFSKKSNEIIDNA